MKDTETKNQLPKDEELEELTNLFKVLGDMTRAKILYTIETQELCVNEICTKVNMTKSAVSHQLKTLKLAHLVKSRKLGKEVYYTVDDEHVALIFRCALEHVQEDK